MSLDLVAAGLLGVFTALGFFRGALASALAIATLVLGYVAALVLGPQVGPALAGAVGAPPLLAVPLGGAAAFAGVAVALAVVGALARRSERKRRGDAPRSSGDRVLGAGLGALRGAFVVLLVGWLGLWLEAFQTLLPGARPGAAEPVVALGASHVGSLAQRAVEGGAQALLGGGGAEGRVAARVLARPAESLGGLRGVLESPRFEALRSDEAFWSALEAGDVDAALARGSFRLLAHDPSLRRDLASLGLVDEADASDAAAVERELRDVVLEIAPRVRGVRGDPEFQALLEDPGVRRALERGEPWALLQHAGFQRLVTRLASGAPPGA